MPILRAAKVAAAPTLGPNGLGWSARIFEDADVLGGEPGPATEFGCGAHWAVDRNERLPDPDAIIHAVRDPTLAGLLGVAAAEIAFEHARGNLAVVFQRRQSPKRRMSLAWEIERPERA